MIEVEDSVSTPPADALTSAPPPFSNRPSKAVHLSRSVAVMAVTIFRIKGGGLWVPLGKRSQAMSEGGLYCLACGYLDWDETAQQAVIREIWEEIGLNLSDHLPASPWFVQSDPEKDARQNVTLRFGAIIDVDNLPLPNPNPSEVEAVEWTTVEDAIARQDLAFNHGEIIREFLALQGIEVPATHPAMI